MAACAPMRNPCALCLQSNQKNWWSPRRVPKMMTGWWFRAWFRPLCESNGSSRDGGLHWGRAQSMPRVVCLLSLPAWHKQRVAALELATRRRRPLQGVVNLQTPPRSSFLLADVIFITFLTICLPFFSYIIGLVGALGFCESGRLRLPSHCASPTGVPPLQWPAAEQGGVLRCAWQSAEPPWHQ